ncbi:hypothetical protein QQP08_022709 [Theobroma cacao]|nr:hypothetical protein QQP08_022709 [Theobroma cacao]
MIINNCNIISVQCRSLVNALPYRVAHAWGMKTVFIVKDGDRLGERLYPLQEGRKEKENTMRKGGAKAFKQRKLDKDELGEDNPHSISH